uniref:Ig-like domain-containing protein n=1 Tax=Tetraodon nigroviridis TaxID=99883 RepID=H3BXS1_TETNG
CLPTGLVDGSDVTQPALLWKVKGDNATIDCNHTKDATYYQMYWYRELPGKTMEEVVFTTTVSKAHDFGTFSKEKYSATKVQAESGTFTVKNLEAADTGLYFCAVSEHSDADTDPAYFGPGTRLTVL